MDDVTVLKSAALILAVDYGNLPPRKAEEYMIQYRDALRATLDNAGLKTIPILILPQSAPLSVVGVDLDDQVVVRPIV